MHFLCVSSQLVCRAPGQHEQHEPPGEQRQHGLRVLPLRTREEQGDAARRGGRVFGLLKIMGMVGAFCGPKQVISNSEIGQQAKTRQMRTKMNTLIHLLPLEKSQGALLASQTSNQWHLLRF